VQKTGKCRVQTTLGISLWRREMKKTFLSGMCCLIVLAGCGSVNPHGLETPHNVTIPVYHQDF
jgi:hypothetical protein